MNVSSDYYQSTRPDMVIFLPDDYSRVLEIGCAAGGFRSSLKPNCEYWGIEIVETIAETASLKLDKILIGSYLEVFDQLPDSFFDLIICNDVIEHMVDHEEFFRTIKKKIKSDACLVLSVPNVRYLWNLHDLLVKKDWQYKDNGLLDRTHLRFFTERSLRRVVIDSGFSIEMFQGVNSILPFGQLSILERLYCRLMILVFGQDLQFLQFGVRIRYNHP